MIDKIIRWGFILAHFGLLYLAYRLAGFEMAVLFGLAIVLTDTLDRS